MPQTFVFVEIAFAYLISLLTFWALNTFLLSSQRLPPSRFSTMSLQTCTCMCLSPRQLEIISSDLNYKNQWKAIDVVACVVQVVHKGNTPASGPQRQKEVKNKAVYSFLDARISARPTIPFLCLVYSKHTAVVDSRPKHPLRLKNTNRDPTLTSSRDCRTDLPRSSPKRVCAFVEQERKRDTLDGNESLNGTAECTTAV